MNSSATAKAEKPHRKQKKNNGKRVIPPVVGKKVTPSATALPSSSSKAKSRKAVDHTASLKLVSANLERLQLTGSQPIAAAYGTGATTEGSKELIMKQVFTFDAPPFFIDTDNSTAGTTGVFWNFSQPTLFATEGLMPCRPIKAKLYVLPLTTLGFNSPGTSQGTYIVYSGCLVRGNVDTSNFLAGTSQAIVKPDFSVNWQLINSFDYDKLFDSSVYIPAGTGNGIELCRVTPADSDTSAAISAPPPSNVGSSSIQCMLELWTASPMSFGSEVSTAVYTTSDPLADSPPFVVDPRLCVRSYSRVQNVD